MRSTLHIDGNPLDPVVLFLGTDEEIAKFDETESRLEGAWANVLNDPAFKGLRFDGEFPGTTMYLTPSIRVEDAFQLSFMDQFGPVMHETYSRTEEGTRSFDAYLARTVETTHPFSKLLQRLSNLTPDQGIDITLDRDERKMAQNRVASIKEQHQAAMGKDKDRTLARERG